MQLTVNLFVIPRARGPFSSYLKYLMTGYVVHTLILALRRQRGQPGTQDTQKNYIV